MKTLYLDIFSGISGDMFIGALIDLGIDAGELERELKKLNVGGYHLHVRRAQKSAIAGTKFDVHLEEDHRHDTHEHDHQHRHGDLVHAHPHSHAHHHDHDDHNEQEHAAHGAHGGPLVETSAGVVELSVFETNVPPRFRLYFRDANGKSRSPIPPAGLTLETIRHGGKRQAFKFKRDKTFLEATEELPEPHEFTAILKLNQGKEKHEIEFVEAHHHHHHHGHGGESTGQHHHPHDHDHEHSGEHDHDHTHEHEHGHDHDHAHGRNYAQIKELISKSSLSDWVKRQSIGVFHRIAEAEGKIHGLPPEEVHFHEVGAVDSIVDIVGACVALELIGKPRVLAAPVVEGTGWINCAHGRFPIPAPATLEILGARGVGITQCDEPHELVTPTGAALLAQFVERFGPMQDLVAEKIGFGLGTRDNKTRPNVLRAILGTTSGKSSSHDWQTDTVAILETNLDDVNPEILGHFIERALADGALDVFHTAIQMKKNRPGVLLTVLCAETQADKFSEMILRETSAFGIRRTTAERRKLAREFVEVKTPYGKVPIKIGKLDGKVVQSAPEFEACRKLAEAANVPLKQVYEAALKAFSR